MFTYNSLQPCSTCLGSPAANKGSGLRVVGCSKELYKVLILPYNGSDVAVHYGRVLLIIGQPCSLARDRLFEGSRPSPTGAACCAAGGDAEGS